MARVKEIAPRSRSHAPRGNARLDALRRVPRQPGRRASKLAFPRGAWERGWRPDSLLCHSRIAFECLGLVGFLPGKLRALATEVTVAGGLLVDRPAQVQRLD